MMPDTRCPRCFEPWPLEQSRKSGMCPDCIKKGEKPWSELSTFERRQILEAQQEYVDYLQERVDNPGWIHTK